MQIQFIIEIWCRIVQIRFRSKQLTQTFFCDLHYYSITCFIFQIHLILYHRNPKQTNKKKKGVSRPLQMFACRLRNLMLRLVSLLIKLYTILLVLHYGVQTLSNLYQMQQNGYIRYHTDPTDELDTYIFIDNLVSILIFFSAEKWCGQHTKLFRFWFVFLLSFGQTFHLLFYLLPW